MWVCISLLFPSGVWRSELQVARGEGAQQGDVVLRVTAICFTVTCLRHKVGFQRRAAGLRRSGKRIGMLDGDSLIILTMNQQDWNLAQVSMLLMPAFDAQVWPREERMPEANTEVERAGNDNGPGERGEKMAQLAQRGPPALALVGEAIADKATQDIIEPRVGAIGNDGGHVRVGRREQGNRSAHRKPLNDDFPRQRLRLARGGGDSRFQIAHFGHAAARNDAFAFPMPAKIEEQDVVTILVFQSRSRPQR